MYLLKQYKKDGCPQLRKGWYSLRDVLEWRENEKGKGKTRGFSGNKSAVVSVNCFSSFLAVSGSKYILACAIIVRGIAIAERLNDIKNRFNSLTASSRSIYSPPVICFFKSVSEWAEKNRVLDGKTSAAPGPWRNAVTPYLVESGHPLFLQTDHIYLPHPKLNNESGGWQDWPDCYCLPALHTKQKKRHVSSVAFHINTIYSPWVRFGEVAYEFLKAKDDPALLMNFINSWLAEPFREEPFTGMAHS